jgi:GT2 family glycosyltransferase
VSEADPVCAMVVTYNRQPLLRECLDAVLAQTRPAERIMVVNNSTDDTAEMLRVDYPQVEVLETGENWACAGGFHDGLTRQSATGEFGWYWLMDDDTVPTPTALEKMLGGLSRVGDLPPPAILASKVLWTNGDIHRMGWPWTRWDQDELLDAFERQLLPLSACTYVSMLVSDEAVKRYGVPIKHWFIWGDDIEWTTRLLKHEAGYLVPESIAVHKTKANYDPTQSDDVRFYYDVRNKLFMLRGDSWTPKDRFWFAVMIVRTTLSYLVFNRFRPRNVWAVLRGLRDGVSQPRI